MSNITTFSEITLEEVSTPTALANHGKLYTKTDNKCYFQDGAGSEHELSTNGGGGNLGLELVGTTTISNDSEIVFTSLDDGYTHLFRFDNIVVATDDVEFYMQISRNGGSSYITSNYFYYSASSGSSGSGLSSQSETASQHEIVHNLATFGIGNAAGESYSGEIILSNPANSGSYPLYENKGVHVGSNSIIYQTRGGGGVKDSTGSYDAVRFYASSGNLSTGTIKHYRYL